MIIILFGPPGAGKGTQGDNISKEYNLVKISTGDLLREEIKKKTILGNNIKNLMDDGFLVSDDIINNLIEKILSNKKSYNHLIFDGYPRNLNQAKNLEYLITKYDQKIVSVLSLKVEKKTIIKRILGRQICLKCKKIFNKFFNPPNEKNHNCDPKFLQKRTDDNEKSILNRFVTYEKITFPIIDFYRKQKILHEIDAQGDISEIYAQIRPFVSILKT